MGLISFLCIFLQPLMSIALETHFNSQVDFESHYYFADLPAPTRNNDQIIRFEPSLELKFNKRSRMSFKPHLRSNLSTDESPEKTFLNPKEAFWEIKTSPWRFRIGADTNNWGVIDGFSPLDVTNGRAMFNPLSADKRASGRIDINYDHGSFQIQALYIPYQARTLLPSTDSRWLPRELLFNSDSESLTFLLPDSFNYHYPGADGVNEAVQNNFGFKVSTRYDEWDFNAVFFDGSSVTPQFRAEIDAVPISTTVFQGLSDVNLTPVYYRQQTVGGNIVWAPENLIIRVETAYGKSRRDNTLIPSWIWQSALAIEKPISIGSSTLTIVAQTYYAENKDPIDNLGSSSSRIFDRAAVLGARYAFPDETNLLFTTLYNYDNDSYFARLTIDRRFWDKYKVGLTGDLIEGSDDTLLGTYTKNDRIIATLGYTW